jgi:hypothetical protein
MTLITHRKQLLQPCINGSQKQLLCIQFCFQLLLLPVHHPLVRNRLVPAA